MKKLIPDKDHWLINIIIISIFLFLFISICLPISQILLKSFQDANHNWIGLSNYISFFSKESTLNPLLNSLYISTLTTIISVSLAYIYTYSIIHRKIFAKSLFKMIAILPLFVPTMMHGLALIYLFGNKGFITTGFFGAIQEILNISTDFHFEIYGLNGIIISEVIYTFPQAVLILSIAFLHIDQRLYDASKSLGISKWKSFLYITFAHTKYGIFAAMLMSFILSFTDFGAPKIIGGKFDVLAVDIYQNVIGLKDFQMGSVISIVITFPLFIAFFIDRWIKKKQALMETLDSLPYQVDKNKLFDSILFIFTIIIASAILAVILTVFLASIVKVWPYSLINSESLFNAFTLNHYNFSNSEGISFDVIGNTVFVSLISALLGSILAFLAAYFFEKFSQLKLIRSSIQILSLVPLALPGLVIGFSYILFFNQKSILSIPNPFNFLYNSPWILVLANIVHFFAVSFIIALTSLKKSSKDIEKISQSLKLPFYYSLFRVTIPINMAAILDIIIYFFINSMVTISAVIFLYPADFPLASIAIIQLDEAGDTHIASAVSMILLVMNLIVFIILKWLRRFFIKK